jgi:esterase/lipase superfamily enzyme
MPRDYVTWDSGALGRRMELLWFGHGGRPVLVFPTSQGRFYQFEDFGMIAALADKIDVGEIQVVCVDSVDSESWYDAGAPPAARAVRQTRYDAYLHDELLPYILNRSKRADLIAYGASFGAYHAANLAGRYPERISRAICFSGVYDIHRFLDGYWDDNCYFHCPTAYIANMDEAWTQRLARVDWVIATGEGDSLAEDNRRFADLLARKGIANHLEIWPGVFGHDWPFWKENLRRFVP